MAEIEAEGFIIEDTQGIYEEIQKKKKEDEENKKQSEKKDEKPISHTDSNDYWYCSVVDYTPITYRILP